MNTKNIPLSFFFSFFILLLPLSIKSDALNKNYFDTNSPLNGWLNCKITGPENLAVSELNTFTLELFPVNWESNAHRYKWIPTLWGPDIEICLLMPQGIVVAPMERGRFEFSGAKVEFGYPKVGPRRFFHDTDTSSEKTSTIIGEILSKALGTVGGLAISIASAAEAIGSDANRRTILEQFDKDDYEKVPLELPTPDCEFTAPEIRFNLVWEENYLEKPIGILLKATKRTRLGQYKEEYFLIEFIIGKSTYSPKDSKIILFDDFDNNSLSSQWEVKGSGSYAVENGVIKIENRSRNDHLSLVYSNMNFSGNYQIILRARLIESGNRGWGTSSDHLIIQLSNTNSNRFTATGWRQNEYNDVPLWIEEKKRTREIGTVGHNAYNFNEYDWHLIKITRNGNKLETYLNDNLCYKENIPDINADSILISASHGIYEIDYIEIKQK